MKLIFLGSGSAFVTGKENYHSNILIEENGKKMLYDCGTTINDALDLNGTDVIDIDTIFISHLHGDHSAGLEFVGFKTYFSTSPYGEKKVKLISSKSILSDLWNHQLSASMDSIKGIQATLETFFNVNPVSNLLNSDNLSSFKFEDLTLKPISTIHSDMKSFALYIEEKKVLITGDTKFTPEHLNVYYNEANIIFQDCEFQQYSGGAHAQFHELKTLATNVKEKMYLYHYMLNGKTFEVLEQEVIEAGFKGLIPRGFELEIQ